MTNRNTTPETAASILKNELKRYGVTLKHTQILSILAKVSGYRNLHAQQAAQEAPPEPAGANELPVVGLFDQPLPPSVLRRMEAEGNIEAIIEIELNTLVDGDLEALLDQLSERFTGSLCGLSDISYEMVGVNSRNDALQLRVEAAEFGWETIPEDPENPAPQWTEELSRKAKAEGWDLFSVDDDGSIRNEVQRLDETGQLSNDDEALRIVMKGTEAHHAAAREIVKLTNPAEWEKLQLFL